MLAQMSACAVRIRTFIDLFKLKRFLQKTEKSAFEENSLLTEASGQKRVVH